MGNTVGDFYNPAIAMAARSLWAFSHNSEEQFLEELLESKDDIDAREVIEHMDDFSCREEMERFVENCEPED